MSSFPAARVSIRCCKGSDYKPVMKRCRRCKGTSVSEVIGAAHVTHPCSAFDLSKANPAARRPPLPLPDLDPWSSSGPQEAMMETPPRPPRSTDRTRDRRSSLHFDRLTSRWHLRSPSPSHPPFSSPSTADGPPAADTGPSASSAVKPLNVRKKGRKASTSAGLPPRGKASRPSLSTDAGALDRTVALARVVKHLIVESGPFTEVEDGLRVKLYLKVRKPSPWSLFSD